MLKSAPTILLMAITAATPLLAAAETPENDRYAAIFPPGWQARDVVMAAAESGQSTLTFGRTENIGIFVLSDPSARQALRDAGAWIILPASAFRGCLVEPFGQTVRTARESLPS